MFGLDTGYTFLLILCLLAAFAFEFINGFHDTANAVATVIYTHSLKPTTAVIWSGIWNFIGVYIGGIAVAIGIINLLPTEIIVDQNLSHNIAMIFALIITAIIWNLATWYIGLPCSSSHTLIGSIFGVGLAFMLLPGNHGIALNWKKVEEAGLSLLFSPVFGFGLALLLMFILKVSIKNKQIFKEPPAKKPPPMWIRSILIFTSTSVSFAHGSNDGQKGVGLVMLILIGFSPVFFSVDRSKSPVHLLDNLRKIEWTFGKIDKTLLTPDDKRIYNTVNIKIDSMKCLLVNTNTFSQVSKTDHFVLRKDIFFIARETEGIISRTNLKGMPGLTRMEVKVLQSNIKQFRSFTEYAPKWVILFISLALGLGTMVGWKRIVVTIGEKIGKTHLTYAQGASANLVAASTIIASSFFGLPVSTTHVLTSGIAGTMVAGKGKKNLSIKTLQNIVIAWVITIPVTVILSGGLFLLLRWAMN
jgi:phosphate/sulfate permease